MDAGNRVGDVQLMAHIYREDIKTPGGIHPYVVNRISSTCYRVQYLFTSEDYPTLLEAFQALEVAIGNALERGGQIMDLVESDNGNA